MNKRILFISNWSIGDGLTTSTILPKLVRLRELEDVESIILVTIERGEVTGKVIESIQSSKKVKHIPLYTGGLTVNFIRKAFQNFHQSNSLKRLVKDYNINIIWGHGTPAGALAYSVYREIKIPFYVDLFEPHADYMLESGIWSRWGLKYIFQKHWEQQQKRHALGLMPVAEGYRQLLISEGINSGKVITVPCSVNAATFAFDSTSRYQLRNVLQLGNATVGIYVGKFGGLYYEAEAFQIFKSCFERFPDFRMIILSPQSEAEVKRGLSEYLIDLQKVYVLSVPHEAVPSYLSAADFAFATYKPGASKKYLSPVKIGEYWANGLPVLLTEGVGDDSDTIQREGGGATFNLSKPGSLEGAVEKIVSILRAPAHRKTIAELAKKYRNPDKIRQAYEYFFGRQQEEAS